MSNQESNQNTNSTPWILVAVLALLTGVFGFLYVGQKQELVKQESDIVAKAKELAFTKSRLDSVSVALDEKIAEVERLGGDVTELQAMKKKLESDLASFKKTDRFENQKYLAKIKDYEKFLAEKEEELVALRAENQRLVASNDSLYNAVGSLSQEREQLARRQQELRDTVNVFNEQNRALSQKVSLAAALKAQNLSVSTITGKGKEKNKSAYKAKNVDKIKVGFQLAENPLTELEDKQIYMRVLDPTGAVLSEDALAGGEFVTASGEGTKYSTKEIINYTNNNQKVEMVYDYENAFRPGKYSVELYAEGYKIGNSTFVIK